MINIAYVIDTINSPSAGTEKQLLMLLNGIDKSKFTPNLVCLHSSEWLDSQHFPFETVVFDVYRSSSLRHFQDLKKFVRLCKDKQLHIVQTFFVEANKFGILGGHLSHCPITIASRRNVGHNLSRMNLRALRFLQRWTTRYLANSKAAAERTIELENVAPDKIDIIHNGLDLDRFETMTKQMHDDQRQSWQIRDEETVIGIVANLRDVKNIDSLVRVGARLVKDFPRIRFVSVGEGPDRAMLQALIDSSDLNERFLLAGRHVDIVPCLAAFDIAVLCSRFESFSNSLIEYMVAGLPIAASDVGGNREAIRHGQNGLLYPVNDEYELENNLRQLLNNRSFAAELGNRAKKDAMTHYQKETCLRKHEAYYEKLVNIDISFNKTDIKAFEKR